MTVYIFDPEDYTVDSNPTDAWEVRNGFAPPVIKEDADGKYMLLEPTSGDSINVVESLLIPADKQDIDVVCLFQPEPGEEETSFGLEAFVGGSNLSDPSLISNFNAGANIFVFSFFTTRNNLMREISEGSTSSLGTSAAGASGDNFTRFVRFNVTGNTVRAKFWEPPDLEPFEWSIEYTTDVLTTGKIGLSSHSDRQRSIRIRWYSVGSDGDNAVKHNPQEDPGTVKNKVVTETSSTSVELSWTQP